MSYEYSAYSNLSHGNVTPDNERYDMASDESNKMPSLEALRWLRLAAENAFFPQIQSELEKANEENRLLRKSNSNKSIEIEKLIEEIERLKSITTTSDTPRFHYAINRRLWQTPEGKLVSIESIEKLADQLIVLVSLKDKEGNYLIRYKKDIVPIYLVLSQSQKLPFIYIGDIPDFEFFWNDNIAARMQDLNRREVLTIEDKSFRTMVNSKLWKDNSLLSWGRLAINGTQSNEYQKADTIKKDIESFKL